MKKSIFFIVIICAFLFPIISFAGNLKGPLVPCGRSGTPDCTLCHIFVMLQTIIDFITLGIFIFAPIFIAAGGIMILISADTPDRLNLGKSMIKNAIIGLVIALLAWTMINELLIVLAGSTTVGGKKTGKIFDLPWNDIKCEGGGVGNGNGDEGNGDWCQRATPSGSDKWKLTSYIQNQNGQKGDASQQLTSFLNCMYSKMSNLEINAISSNAICNNPSCDTSGPKCGHVANSCHFGGTNCRGSSYAVDFNTNVPCSAIRSAALSCDSNVWVNWENSHTHISVDRTGCGCNEYGSGDPCPN